jgi:hypothetical protein
LEETISRFIKLKQILLTLKSHRFHLFISLFDRFILKVNSIAIRKLPKHTFTNAIAIAILIKDRPESLKICLNSLGYSLKLVSSDLKIKIYLFDDGSKDDSVQEIIESFISVNSTYNIQVFKRSISENSWSSSHNWAVENILGDLLDNTLVGTCDSDLIFTPNWIDFFVIWCNAVRSQTSSRVIYFSAFNSNQILFHKVLSKKIIHNVSYLEKHRIGGAHLFFFSNDYRIKGPYKKSRMKNNSHILNFDDESRETRKINRKGLLSASLENSLVEHQLSTSLLNQNRPNAVVQNTYALNLPRSDWYKSFDLQRDSTIGLLQRNPLELLNTSDSDKIIAGIPVGKNDLDLVRVCIDSLQHFYSSNLKSVFLVTNKKYFNFLRNLVGTDIALYDERDFVPHIDFKEHSNWLLQQILKWNMVLLIKESLLIVDADTILLKKLQINSYKNEFRVDEFVHFPYRNMVKQLLNFSDFYPFSFVTHHQFVQFDLLSSLISSIEDNHNDIWHNVVRRIHSPKSSVKFSEYDTYGLFVNSYHKENLIINYGFNLPLGRKYFDEFTTLFRTYANQYDSLSFHWYLPRKHFQIPGWIK